MLKKINLKNKTALVTGAGKGLGRACAIALAEAGARVVILSRTKSDLDKLERSIKKIKGKTIKNASDFSIFLLEESHVATVTGDAFGCPNNIRISYAASKKQITEAIKRIQSALED